MIDVEFPPSTRHRRQRGAAALLVAILGGSSFGVVGLVGTADVAAAIPLCEVANPPPVCNREQGPSLSHDPNGALDAPTFGAATVRVTGWARDFDTTGPVTVIVSVDGTPVGSGSANLSRPLEGFRGFDLTVPAAPSAGTVCVNAVNVGLGRDAQIGCRAFPYSTDVTLLDFCGAVSMPLSASLWRLVPPSGQTVQETTSSSAGRIGFVSGRSLAGASVGASLASTSLPGPLFRSGALGALPPGSPTNPAGRLNVAVPCPVRQTPAELNAALARMSVPLPPGVTIGTPVLTLGSGTMTLSVSGVASGTVATVFGGISYREPFSYALTFTLTPSTNMNNPGQIVVVTPTGPGTLTFTGGMGWLLNPLVAPGMEPTVTTAVTSGLQSGIDGAIVATASASVPGGLPAGATISMARIIITPSGASLTPAVGWFG